MDSLSGLTEAFLEDVKQKFIQFKKEFNEQEPLLDIIKGFVNAVNWKVGVLRSEIYTIEGI